MNLSKLIFNQFAGKMWKTSGKESANPYGYSISSDCTIIIHEIDRYFNLIPEMTCYGHLKKKSGFSLKKPVFLSVIE